MLILFKFLHKSLLTLFTLLQSVPVLYVLPHICFGFEELDRRRTVFISILNVFGIEKRALFCSEVRMGVGMPHQLSMYIERFATPFYGTRIRFNPRMDLLVKYQRAGGSKILSALVTPMENRME